MESAAGSSFIEPYIQDRATRDDHLGKMLRNPDSEQGVVHTPREIAQQPALWTHVARLVAEQAEPLSRFLAETGLHDEQDRPHIVMTGAGTSNYIGMSLATLLQRQFRTCAAAHSSTRITADPAGAFVQGQRYLIIHFARSGNSPESRAVIEMALDRHADAARHLVITCNEDGTLAQVARQHPEDVYLLAMPEVCNDKGLAMTSSYSAMVTAGQALAFLDEPDAFVEEVEHMSRAAKHLMDTYADTLYGLATPNVERAFYLGNGGLLGAATESALKVQELTAGDVMAKGEDTMAFRHGPISAVNAQSLVCFFLSGRPHTRDYEVDVLRQYQEAFEEMNARIITVSAQPPEIDLRSNVTSIAYTPNMQERAPILPPHLQVAPAALVGQLYGLFASYRRGRNVDDPSRDKALYNRTVQGVQLYDYEKDGARKDGHGGSHRNV